VVLTSTDALSTKDLIEISTTVGSSPLFDNIEHVTMDFQISVADCRMMESPYHVFDHLLVRDFGMVPSINDTRCGVLKYAGGDLAGWFVKNVGKMIFGELDNVSTDSKRGLLIHTML